MLLALQWHGAQREGRGSRFLADLDRTFKVIRRFPRGGRIVRRNIRQIPLDRFPYVVVYAIRKKEISVLSVFNTWQHPSRRPKR